MHLHRNLRIDKSRERLSNSQALIYYKILFLTGGGRPGNETENIVFSRALDTSKYNNLLIISLNGLEMHTILSKVNIKN